MRRTSVAPSAMKGGGVSPMGEPLAILPPIVPILRICSPAMRFHSSLSSGNLVAMTGSASE
ncbi:hypothetical protein D9M68_927930 [compost metagenome]